MTVFISSAKFVVSLPDTPPFTTNGKISQNGPASTYCLRGSARDASRSLCRNIIFRIIQRVSHEMGAVRRVL